MTARVIQFTRASLAQSFCASDEWRVYINALTRHSRIGAKSCPDNSSRPERKLQMIAPASERYSA